jgi:cytochrome bd-type quinol oxidase subunit 2
MFVASMLALQTQGDQAYRAPSYFQPVFLVLLVGGGLAWLVAAVLGFARARVFGSSARWFALSAVCLILYHLHLFLIGIAVLRSDNDMVLSVGAFFNLFVVIGALCAIVGFARLNDPRP